jgi:dihydrofolate reductase
MNSPIISIVVSVDEKNGIGRENKMAWHIKADLVHFKKLTEGKIVIIGENTFKSMDYYYTKSGREMPAKLYIVLTPDEKLSSARKNITFVHSLEEALSKAKETGEGEIFIAGGAYVFKETVSLADRIYLTKVHASYDCDTFFPDYSEFKEISSEDAEENGTKFSFKVLEKV